MNMIEKVAIALAMSANPGNWISDFTENHRKLWRTRAKAAIEAILDYYDNQCSSFEASDVPITEIPNLKDMIDAALKES